MTPSTRTLIPVSVVRGVAALAAIVFVAGCGPAIDQTTPARRTHSAAPAAPLRGAPARAARAVDVLARALRDGDVERMCRPGAVFTSAVVATMNGSGDGCEASIELSQELRHPAALTVANLAYKPGLATALVRVGRGSTIPLDIVRSGRRWLVSFSDGVDPVGALQRASQS